MLQQLLRNTTGTVLGPPTARTLSFLRRLETMVALNDNIRQILVYDVISCSSWQNIIINSVN